MHATRLASPRAEFNKKFPLSKLMLHRAGWLSGDALFESRPGYRLSSLRFYVVFSVPPGIFRGSTARTFTFPYVNLPPTRRYITYIMKRGKMCYRRTYSVFRRNLLSLSSGQDLIRNHLLCHVLYMVPRDQDKLKEEVRDRSKGRFDFCFSSL